MSTLLLFLALVVLAITGSLILTGWLARYAMRGGLSLREEDMGHLAGG